MRRNAIMSVSRRPWRVAQAKEHPAPADRRNADATDFASSPGLANDRRQPVRTHQDRDARQLPPGIC